MILASNKKQVYVLKIKFERLKLAKIFNDNNRNNKTAIDWPFVDTLKPHISGPIYSNTVFGTLAVDGWVYILVHRGGAWAGCGPAQSPHRCTKCNSPPIKGQCTNLILFDVALWFPLNFKGFNTFSHFNKQTIKQSDEQTGGLDRYGSNDFALNVFVHENGSKKIENMYGMGCYVQIYIKWQGSPASFHVSWWVSQSFRSITRSSAVADRAMLRVTE